ncbi:FAD/NAD(P)-binding protein [Actinospica durhamensis]|uniref:FAD/NAD(P)-binding protein n=1 Tax=Actinospica durhamensis TaxID=1508375 RepID=A0A941ENY7_9ACTN|nr:FAD/NAD(P)-binding protein [Actinospica durhamensis]MBR7832509.1 FAD/NAD(P)-binding protein [Actinospica durhamensis]
MNARGVKEICIVGCGPRGLSVLERLCANERAGTGHERVTVHVIDPVAAGPGSVWRTGQSQHLLMNTVASQITVFTDDSAQIEGPIEPGPSLYEWARGLALLGELGGYDEAVIEQAREIGPDTYPTRALYGSYLRDAFDRIVRNAPAHVQVVVHRSRAVAIADVQGVSGGPQGLRLEDGVRLNALDAIVLAQGHVPVHLSPREARAASLARIHYLTYITPSNPADVDLDAIEPGQNVLLRGLGLNFFDYMTLLTAGRGGRYTRDAEDRLVYEPSGREPRLVAFSRRGVPYHARGRNEKGATGRYLPRLLTPAYIRELRGAHGDRSLNFSRDLWRVIAREVESVYYSTLLRQGGLGERECEAFLDDYLAAPDGELAEVLDLYGIAEGDRWDWQALSRPHGDREFADRREFRTWLLGYLERDMREADVGNLSSPLKSALDVLRDLRNEIRLAVDHAGLEGGSYRDDLEGWYTPLNAFLSIGPPASRIEEMIALIEAGVLELTGPGTEIRLESGPDAAFVASSRQVPGEPIRARTLIEARLPEIDLRRTADPLLRHLLETEQAAPYRIPGEHSDYVTGGLAVTERPYQLLDARGRAHPRRFAYGVPTESVHWVTAAGIRPGVDSVTLGDSDAIARAVLALPPATSVPAAVRPPEAEVDLTGVLI